MYAPRSALCISWPSRFVFFSVSLLAAAWASLQSLAAENVSAKTRDLQGEIAQKSK